MAIFKKGKRGNKDLWWVDYYHQGQRKRECVGTSKTLAEKALNVRKGEILQGRFNMKASVKTPYFKDFAQKYLEYSKANKRSYRRDQDIVKALLPYFRGKRLSEITAEMIEKYKLDRVKKVSRASVNREMDTFSALFNKAIEWGKAEANPLAKVKDFKVENRRERILSKEEETKLLEAVGDSPPYLRMFIVIALHTGIRKSVILNLPWADVDFEQGVITARKTKSGKDRTIPLNPLLRDELVQWRRHTKGLLVFPHPKTGKPIKDIKTSWGKALKRAGIEGLRIHDLRHVFGTRLSRNGVDLGTIGALMGHVDAKTTMRYINPTPLSKTLAVDTLAEGHPVKNGHFLDTRRKSKDYSREVTHA